MAQTDALRRYLEAGLEFTQLTRDRAEAVIKDLVRAGEVQREQAQDWVEELVERSRRNTDHLVQLIRREINNQLAAMGIATRDDLDALERRLMPAKKPATSPAPAKPKAAKSSGKATPVEKKAGPTKAAKAAKKAPGRTR